MQKVVGSKQAYHTVWGWVKSKRDDILERQGLIFIRYRERYSGIMKDTDRTFDFLSNDSDTLRIALGKFPVAKGTSRKSFQGFLRLWQSFRVILSWVEEFRTLYSGYGNWVQTQQKPPRSGPCGFAFNPEVGNILRDIPNMYNRFERYDWIVS